MGEFLGDFGAHNVADEEQRNTLTTLDAALGEFEGSSC